ncbi:hypothetical protein CR513_11143, partial [Mucuna pruriens]
MPTHVVNGKIEPKPKSLWSNAERKRIQHNMKAKNIIIVALFYVIFHRIFNCKIAKDKWDILQLRESQINTLIHEYKIFKIKNDQCAFYMQKCFTHIVNHFAKGGSQINMVLQAHLTTMADPRNSKMHPSTVAKMLATVTVIAPQTTMVSALLITVVISMVMATGDSSRVALMPPQGTTTVAVINNYLYLICSVGNMIYY